MKNDIINLFFSHDWGVNNSNHIKVSNIVKELKTKGYTSWLDEENMKGNIDAAMADGIDNSQVIIICITKNYCNKINNTSRNMNKRDNCLKEWTYANTRNKLLIPIIMEKNMLDINNWPPGIVSMYLGCVFYIDFTNDKLDISINDLIKLLNNYKIYPNILPSINDNLSNLVLSSKKKLPRINKSIQEKLPIIINNNNISNNSINNTSNNNTTNNSIKIFNCPNDNLEDTSPISPKENNLSIRIEEIIDKDIDIKKIKPPDVPNLNKPSLKTQFIKSKTTNFSNTSLNLRYKNTAPYILPKKNRLNKTSSYISNVPLLRLCYPKQVTI